MYKQALNHFKKTEHTLYCAGLTYDIADIHRSRDVFAALVRAIINQQLSGKAADTIYARLEGLLRGRKLKPTSLLSLKPAALRQAGLSAAKVKSLRGLATAVEEGQINLKTLHQLSDDEVMEKLTALHGIGPWTAEMILMFSLGRLDTFSRGDLGLRKGIMYLYGLKKLPSERQMAKLERLWAPYRSYAARILWRVADERKGK